MAEGQRKTMTGRVMSDKMDKTVVVMVQSTTRHRLYKKIMRRSKRYLAHDEGDAKPGDTVRIEETRPYSRNKRWRVTEVLRRGEVAEIAPREIDSEYITMQRQVETPAPPPPRKDDDEQEALEPPEAEAAEAAPSDSTEAVAEQPETSAATEDAAENESETDETPEEADAGSDSGDEAPSEDAASEEATEAENEDEKA